MFFITIGLPSVSGIRPPLDGLLRKVPFPESVGSLLSLTTTLAFAPELHLREVAQYTMTVLGTFLGAVSSIWSHPMSTKWVVMWGFCLFTGVLCTICACEEMFSRIYITPQTAAPKPLPLLITPTSSGDNGTSGSTSEREGGEHKWEDALRQDGLFASACDARRTLIDGVPANHLKCELRKRPWVNLPTLLGKDELYPSGYLAKHTTTDWVNAQLRTFHRGPYIQDRESRRCQAGNCVGAASVWRFTVRQLNARRRISKKL